VTQRGERLPVLFLWHNHQPFYQSPEMERPVMPWVRLHAVRGYLDMLTAVRETGARVTSNFSPSLLEQIQFAAGEPVADEFERLSRTPVADLLEVEKRVILADFFSINWDVHVRPHPRYQQLLHKRGEHATDAALQQAMMEYTGQDYTDLIALFNLIWIGFAGRRDPVIADLLAKRKGYSHGDILTILDFHHRILSDLLPAYRELRDSGTIEISTSPYSHAILPLLCDSHVALADIQRQRLPRMEYRHPEDAERQLKLARAVQEDVWGEAPVGLWPSEGSVSDEALEIAARCGYRWAATDQAILERGERSRKDSISHFYSQAWERGPHGMRLYFRDRALSDAIGFRYSSMPAREAVREFVAHAERIESATRGDPARCLVIALDGENPWEHYADGGEKFLHTLYRELDSHPHLKTQTFGEHAQSPTRERVHHVHPGSWIDSDFHIWIGDPQKNEAWIELRRARHMLDELGAADERREECWKWMLRAQGSDWFWWYGEPFSSVYEHQFDALFRSYLKAVYQAAGRQYPPALDAPIKVSPRAERRLQPVFPVFPILDGRDTSYFEWANACKVDPRQYGATMGRAEHTMRALFYGFGKNELYFRFDPAATLRPQASSVLILHVLSEDRASLSIPLNEKQPLSKNDGFRWVSGRIVEVALAYERVGLQLGGECQFWVEIIDDNAVIEKLPPAGAYHFVVPTDEMIAANWMV
jgi:alpha-amylase/alpha-mannosidase (GH57 family)